MSSVDLASVPPQGSYIARRCPIRVQNDVLRPGEPRRPDPAVQRRFDQGNAFEASTIRGLEGLGIAAQVVADPDGADLATAASDGLVVLLGATLPTDRAGRRVGRPDMLVAAPGGGFRPVDIKHHMVLDAGDGGARSAAALTSTLDRPALESATADETHTARRHEPDVVQLAHYQRMLEAAGLAAPDGRWAGILGTEGRIVWHDLDAPMWRSAGDADGTPAQSSMERYDAEFALRLDIIAAALASRADPSIPLLASPVRISECDECPWWDYCQGQLQAGYGDISLLPRLGLRETAIHRAHGVRDRGDLARLDPVAARLVCSGINVAELQRLAEGLEDDTPIMELGAVVRAKTQLARLQAEGVRHFGDLFALDAKTATYFGSGMKWLPEQIDLARAALGPEPVYRRRGVTGLEVPRADVEVDVDMENIEEGVYLWGALHTTRNQDQTYSTYHGFVTWEPFTPEEEQAVFLEFWSWLTAVRDDAHSSGKTFAAYCYNASAENTYLRKMGLAVGAVPEVSEFIQSGEWVDLLRTVDGQLITGTGSGLKAIAPLAGFHWGVSDPGGAFSMVQYDLAAAQRHTPERDEAREWLLTYNRGDVEATLAIRDWIETSAAHLPSVDAIDSSAWMSESRLAGADT